METIFVTPFKSGTTSMGKALQILNYKVAGHCPEIFSEMEYGLIFVCNDAMRAYKSLRYVPEEVKADIHKLLNDLLWDRMMEYDSATDYPLGHEGIHPFVKKLIFPECKFIYLDRDEQSYLNSVKNQEKYMTKPHIKIIWEYSSLAKALTINNYRLCRKPYEQLKEDFPDDVLFMKITDGWEPLLKFLKIEIDSAELPDFPWENKGKFLENSSAETN